MCVCVCVRRHIAVSLADRSGGRRDCSANAVAANCLVSLLVQPAPNAEGSHAGPALFSERLMIVLCDYEHTLTHTLRHTHREPCSVPPLKCNNGMENIMQSLHTPMR